jgi:acetyl-CoA carboxylase carboxyltransferase component
MLGQDCFESINDTLLSGGHADGAIWRKAQYTEQMAREMRVPLIRLLDGSSGGGSVASILKQGYSYIPPSVKMEWMIKLMTDVPVVAACLGPAVGLAAAKATLTHFSVMCESDIGSLFAAGPPVVIEGWLVGLAGSFPKASHLRPFPATHENVTKTQLGGPLIHTRNGTIDNAAKTEAECFETLRRFLSYLPSSRFEMTPSLPYTGSRNNFGRGGLMLGDDGAALMAAIPHNRKKPYDPKLYVERIVDEGTLFETGPDWGKEHRTVSFLDRLVSRPIVF